MNEKSTNLNWLKLIATMGLIIILILTKPNENDFKAHIQRSIERESSTYFDEALGKLGDLIAGSYDSKNFIILTVNRYSVLGETFVYVGVFNHFIRIK